MFYIALNGTQTGYNRTDPLLNRTYNVLIRINAVLNRTSSVLNPLLSLCSSPPGEVFLDPGTAQRNLVLSEDGRQVMYEERKHNQSEGTRRFNPALFVLACECLSSGRHYWEVDVGRKTAWTVGVVRASARRKGEIKLSPDGGYWGPFFIMFILFEFKFHTF